MSARTVVEPAWHWIRYQKCMPRKLQIFILIAVLFVTAFFGSGWHFLQTSQGEARQYISSWEEDLAKDLLIHQDQTLLKKISGHLNVMGFESGTESCRFGFAIPLTLYGLKATELELCQRENHVLKGTLLSPSFLLILMVGLLLIWFFSIANWKVELQNSRLEAKVQLQEETARVARQVAHDIRSPLSALQAVSASAPNTNDDRMRLLRSAVDRIKKISDDLLTESKSHLAGNMSRAELLRSVQAVADEMIAQFPEQSIEWDVQEFDFHLPLRSETWERMFQNLLKNAFEANQSVSATRILVRIQKEKNHFVLLVQDQGSGLSKEVARRIGEEGFTFGKSDGSGLGVAYVRRCLESLGGALAYQSTTSKGAIAKVTCPILQS